MASSEVSGRSEPAPVEGFAAPKNAAPLNAIVAVLAISGTVVALMQTLMIPLLPVMPRLLGASAADTSWTITATLLTGAVANPVFGRLGDLFGKRRMMLASAYLLAAGSLICALSSSLVPVVAGRALQGLGLSIIPLGISIMRDLLPAKRLIPAMALMSSSLGIGGALGLPIAALVAQNFDWHMVFWGSLGASALLIAMITAVVPESSVRGKGTFDVPGAIALTAGLVALLLAVSKGSAWGWTNILTLGMVGAAVVVLLGWGWWEARTPAPLVDLRTSSRRPVLLTNTASIMLGFAMYSMSLVVPQLLQLPRETGHGLGQSLVGAALWMAPGGLVMMAASPVAGRLIAARGPKVSLVAGSGVIALGYAVSLGLMSTTWGLLIVSAMISLGVGLAYAAMPTLIMGSVPASEGAAANGLNTLMRSIGTSTSSAVIGVVLANMTVTFGSTSVPSLTGMRVGLLIGAGAALAACLIGLTIPRSDGEATENTQAAGTTRTRVAAAATATDAAGGAGAGAGAGAVGIVRAGGGAAVPGQRPAATITVRPATNVTTS